MKSSKLFPLIFILIISSLSIANFTFTIAGWETDPTGDADGINACDITRIDVEVTYHSHPTDDEVLLKTTLLEAPLMDENHTVRYDYNFYVDTSLSDNPDTTDLWGLDGSDIYEYIAHLDCRWVSESWLNTSYLMCTRYYYTGDGAGKTMGTFWWNPNSDTWEATNPGLEVGVVIGNQIVWDVTHAIHREQPIGTGYVIQGAANAGYGFSVKDYAKASGWVDEFDNCCPTPSSGTNTPSFSLPGFGFVSSIVFLGLLVSSISIIRKRRK
ncbi:MAG: hypothetical protein FK733_15405 [Asgard group archaeon]|nr:hypothetical protein [Asgard group archaeon]